MSYLVSLAGIFCAREADEERGCRAMLTCGLPAMAVDVGDVPFSVEKGEAGIARWSSYAAVMIHLVGSYLALTRMSTGPN